MHQNRIYHFLLFILVYISNLSHIFSKNHGSISPQISKYPVTFVLNALDNEGFHGMLYFMKQLKAIEETSSVFNIHLCYVFHRQSETDKSASKRLKDYDNVHLKRYDHKRRPDRRSMKYSVESEHVTDIINSIQSVISGYIMENEPMMMISIAFKSGTIPTATASFDRLIQQMTTHYKDLEQSRSSFRNETAQDATIEKIFPDLLLLDKNRRLTSVSDWHDLMIVAFRVNNATKSWLKLFSNIYDNYSKRIAINLIDPRPAMLEATAMTGIRVSYIKSDIVCTIPVPLEILQQSIQYHNEADSEKGLVYQVSRLINRNSSLHSYFEEQFNSHKKRIKKHDISSFCLKHHLHGHNEENSNSNRNLKENKEVAKVNY